MRTLLLLGACCVLLAGSALAQPAPAAPAEPPAGADAGAPPPPDGPDGPGGRHGHRPPPPSKAAHFRIEDGDLRVDVKCADDEPMKACADITMQFLSTLTGPRNP